jgi:hypothetical protein
MSGRKRVSFEMLGRACALWVWQERDHPRLLAAQRERVLDEPPEDPLAALLRHDGVGVDQLPTWPGENLPSGDPFRDWTPHPEDVERAQRPEWRAQDFADRYLRRLTLCDPALAALTNPLTAERRRRAATISLAFLPEIERTLSAVRPLFRDLWKSPAGHQAQELAADRRAHPTARFWRHSWDARVVLELQRTEAHVDYLGRLCREVRKRADRPGHSRSRSVAGSVAAIAANVFDHLVVHHPDGRPPWKDVVLVLEFYEIDLGKLNMRTKISRLKQAVRRYREAAARLARSVKSGRGTS